MPKVDHFAFEVSDIDKSISFYTEILGLKLLFKQLDEVHHEIFAFLELDGGNLELLQALDKDNEPTFFKKHEIKQPYCPHIAIKTENMEKLISKLESKRVTIIKGPLEIPGKVKWVYVSDPDSNIIEFVQWL